MSQGVVWCREGGEMIQFSGHFTTWDEIDNDSWFLIEPAGEDILQISEVDEEGEPFDTLDAKFTVYYNLTD